MAQRILCSVQFRVELPNNSSEEHLLLGIPNKLTLHSRLRGCFLSDIITRVSTLLLQVLT